MTWQGKRESFEGRTYFTLQQCLNAERATRLNRMLDSGTRIEGDDGPDGPGQWHEIEEAIMPYADGIECLKKSGGTVRIFAWRVLSDDEA